jgi:hypothetical protein
MTKGFVCIKSDGRIVHRDEYLKNRATDFDNSGYTSFVYKNELIRILGNMAFVRSETGHKKSKRERNNRIYNLY